MKRDGESQPDLIVSWVDVSRSPGHGFYDRLKSCWSKPGSTALSRTAARLTTRRRQGGGAVGDVRSLFADAVDRLFRGHPQRTRHHLALFRFAVASRVFAADEP